MNLLRSASLIRRGVFLLCLVLLASSVLGGCTGAASPSASTIVAPALTDTPSATPVPTPLPTASPTPLPTPTPAPTATPAPVLADQPTTNEIMDACTSGIPVLEADPYGGDTHSFVEADLLGNDGVWTFEVYIGKSGDLIGVSYTPGVLAKYGVAPIQMVVCEVENPAIRVGSCGYYSAGPDKVKVMLYQGSLTIHIVNATTGKTLGTKTFLGSTACPDSVPMPTDGSTSMNYTNGAGRDLDWITTFTKLNFAPGQM